MEHKDQASFHKISGVGLLADGNIHNIKLIYRYISNNDDPVKTLLTFCGIYHGNSPDIKGNPPYNF